MSERLNDRRLKIELLCRLGLSILQRDGEIRLRHHTDVNEYNALVIQKGKNVSLHGLSFWVLEDELPLEELKKMVADAKDDSELLCNLFNSNFIPMIHRDTLTELSEEEKRELRDIFGEERI